MPRYGRIGGHEKYPMLGAEMSMHCYRVLSDGGKYPITQSRRGRKTPVLAHLLHF
jgi:hypothetical protein